MTWRYNPPEKQTVWWCLLLILCTLAVYWQVRDFDFVTWDDDIYVTNNPYVQAGLTFDSLKYAFGNLDFGHWHPLTWLSHMAAWQAFGARPAWHHLINVIFHIANALLLFLLLNRMTGALWRSWFVAALFALHPLHVESVAWIAERKDVLSTLFWLLTTHAYVSYVRNSTPRNYLPILIYFALGLMCKPMLISLPVTLLLLDYWPLGRLGSDSMPWKNRLPFLKSLILEKLPLLALSIASSIVTYLAGQARMGDISILDMVPWTVRLPNAVISYARYLMNAIWPSKLAAIYPYPLNGMDMSQLLVSGAVLLLITALAILSLRKAPFMAVGWLWYLGTLVPVSGLFIQAGPQAMADRYTYIPLIGVFIAATWGVSQLFERLRKSPTPENRPAKWLARLPAVAGVLVLLPLGVCAWHQAGYWRNTRTLFERAIAVTQNNWLAHNNLGFSLYSQGQIAEAMTHFQHALTIRPDYEKAHNNLGSALDAAGRRDEAAAHYREALRLNPNLRTVHFNLGMLLAAQGKTDEAMQAYLEELRINPRHPGSHNNLGIIYQNRGQHQQAVRHYMDALNARPDYANARFNLGQAYAALGQVDDALLQHQEALRLKPAEFSWRLQYAGLLAQQGRVDEAISNYREVLRIKPDLASAYNSLGAALYLKRDYAAAWSQVKLCRKYGGKPGPAFLSALSRYMSEPPD